MVHHFDHRWATYDGVDAREVTIVEKQDPYFVAMPRYWVAESDVSDRTAKQTAVFGLMGWRKICRGTDERSVISFLFPAGGLGDSGNLILSTQPLSWLLYLASACMVVDYPLRQKLGGTNLNFFQFAQLPFHSPQDFEQTALFVGGELLSRWLAERVLELSFTSWDIAPFARCLGDDGPPFQWDSDRRSLLRAELDAAFFHLYDVSREDAEYIIDTFPIVRRKDEVKYGEYRTKRLIIEMYDTMAEAARTGKSYQTILDPSPGQGRRHPNTGTSS